MIRAEGVYKVFGESPQEALRLLQEGSNKDDIQQETGNIVGVADANFRLAPGEVFVIMGLSGSGKSTLLRCINRLIEPTAGKVFLDTPEGDSIEVTSLDENRLRHIRTHRMSMVFQHFALFPHRTVRSNVAYGLEIQGRSRQECSRIAQDVLDMVGLGQWADSYPSALSGGMQQRVGLARGLATEAGVLLMDEPFSALDPLIKVTMQDELLKIQGQLDRTILFITHDLDEAMRLGDRIAIMESGVIVQIGTPEEILVNPKTEYVADFVEHADPTGVITAGTVALPMASGQLEKVGRKEAVEYHARRSDPDVHYGTDGQGELVEVLVDGSPAKLKLLSEVLTAAGDGAAVRRRKDMALLCPASTVIRDVLKGRVHSTLPLIVVEEGSKRFRGIIDEPELVGGILEKKGYEGLEEARRMQRSRGGSSLQDASSEAPAGAVAPRLSEP